MLTLRRGKWIEELPPLMYHRSNPAVVSVGNDCLLCIGGKLSANHTSSVELLYGDVWVPLTALPVPTYYPSATLMGENLYVMADYTHGYFCSIAHLQTDNTANSSLTPLQWIALPPPPVGSTPAITSLRNRLTIIDSSAIFVLAEGGGEWVKCGRLSGSERSLSLVASVSASTMVVVGGFSGPESDVDADIVDLCIST